MRKILFLASLLLSVTMLAGPVSPDAAHRAANSFMLKHHTGASLKSTPVSAPRLSATGHSTSSQASYYVFNTVGDHGFVIVSGDDRTTDILGYSDNGKFDPNNVPANMKVWLENYALQIAALDEMGIKNPPANAPRPTRNSISPMITSHWDQAGPYWNHCPEFMDVTEEGDTVGELAYTGCVATSMAQIMNYYKLPIMCSKTIPSYMVTFYWQEDYGVFETDPLEPMLFD